MLVGCMKEVILYEGSKEAARKTVDYEITSVALSPSKSQCAVGSWVTLIVLESFIDVFRTERRIFTRCLISNQFRRLNTLEELVVGAEASSLWRTRPLESI